MVVLKADTASFSQLAEEAAKAVLLPNELAALLAAAGAACTTQRGGGYGSAWRRTCGGLARGLAPRASCNAYIKPNIVIFGSYIV